MKDKEKTVDVKVTDANGEKTVKIVVKRPNNALLSQAQRLSAKVWTDCVRDGIMTKKELEKFMKEQDIWNNDKDVEQKKITEEISRLEKELYVSGKNGKLRASEGKNIAIDMRRKRIELRELIAERMSLEQNTAESLSDNARFDFLVANCTFHENGNKVYNNLDEYTANSDSEIAFAAATALAQMMYSVDKDFESKLPENKFLKMFNFVNDDLALVNDKGERVDTEGRRIDEFGYYVNEEGKRVDKDGNLLDENGNYIPSVTYVDDKGKKLSIKDE
ncbi:hypothetical protein EB118_00390 [bacterium]|jgi:hypothetical protein|nr:hypothetical protein [bacterium]NDG28547.1 hypothetical protein [bacterium]